MPFQNPPYTPMPRPTAEVRWIIAGEVPPEVDRWFDGVVDDARQEGPRTDRYLAPTGAALIAEEIAAAVR